MPNEENYQSDNVLINTITKMNESLNSVISNDEQFITSKIKNIINNLIPLIINSNVYESTTNMPNLGEVYIQAYSRCVKQISQIIIHVIGNAIYTNNEIKALDNYLNGKTKMMPVINPVSSLNANISTKTYNAEDVSTKNIIKNFGMKENGPDFFKNGLNCPILTQTDERYQDDHYLAEGIISSQKLACYGCGYVSFAMILSGFKQKYISVTDVLEKLKQQSIGSDKSAKLNIQYDYNNDNILNKDDILINSVWEREGLPDSIIESEDFQNALDISVEKWYANQGQIETYGSSQNFIQQSLDNKKAILATTGPHYFIIIPGPEENNWIDEYGVEHATAILVDPLWTENNKEYEPGVIPSHVDYYEDSVCNGTFTQIWAVDSNETINGIPKNLLTSPINMSHTKNN